MGLFIAVMKYLQNRSWQLLHNFVNTWKTIDLYTLNKWVNFGACELYLKKAFLIKKNEDGMETVYKCMFLRYLPQKNPDQGSYWRICLHWVNGMNLESCKLIIYTPCDPGTLKWDISKGTPKPAARKQIWDGPFQPGAGGEELQKEYLQKKNLTGHRIDLTLWKILFRIDFWGGREELQLVIQKMKQTEKEAIIYLGTKN